MKKHATILTTILLAALLLAPRAGLAAIVTAQDAPAAKPDRKKRLADRLLRKAKSNTEEDLMEGVIRLMNEASRRIGIDFDAGDETVTIQQEIAEKLDEAIARAAKQRRPRRRNSPNANTDKRKMPTASKGQKGKQTEQSAGTPGQDAAQSANGEGTAQGDTPTEGEFAELRRGWGHLPTRDRDELIQGIEEDYIDRYREWIEQYYRALQDINE